MLENLFWIGHAGFYIKTDNSTIFIDPFEIRNLSEKADLILITHAHFDHCSEEDVRKVMKDNTTIIAAEQCKLPFAAATAKPGFKSEVDGIKIEAVPAYNMEKERRQFHPKANNWVGYIITADNTRFYHAGDTDFIPEMKSVKADVAMLPMGGTYTMDADEAIEASNAIGAKVSIPIHYKHLLGREGSAQAEKRFLERAMNAKIMEEIGMPNYDKF